MSDIENTKIDKDSTTYFDLCATVFKVRHDLGQEISELKKERDAYKNQINQLIDIINNNPKFDKKVIVRERGWLLYEPIEIVSK